MIYDTFSTTTDNKASNSSSGCLAITALVLGIILLLTSTLFFLAQDYPYGLGYDTDLSDAIIYLNQQLSYETIQLLAWTSGLTGVGLLAGVVWYLCESKEEKHSSDFIPIPSTGITPLLPQFSLDKSRLYAYMTYEKAQALLHEMTDNSYIHYIIENQLDDCFVVKRAGRLEVCWANKNNLMSIESILVQGQIYRFQRDHSLEELGFIKKMNPTFPHNPESYGNFWFYIEQSNFQLSQCTIFSNKEIYLKAVDNNERDEIIKKLCEAGFQYYSHIADPSCIERRKELLKGINHLLTFY